MKKLLLIFSLTICNTIIKAQYADSNYCSSSAVLWNEDFGNGFPASWANHDSSGYCPWKFSYSGSYGYYNGVFPNGGDTIRSRTPTNGFFICDVDSANYYHNGVGNYDTIQSFFITNAIPLNGNHDLFLEFSSCYAMHYYKKLRGDEFNIALSSDSINWSTLTIPYLYQLPLLNARYVSYDISPYLQQTDTIIYLRFGLNDTTNAWMLDDMRLVLKENYDIAIVEPRIFNTTPTLFGDSLTYYSYTFQTLDTAIGASARIYNRGKQPVYYHFNLNSTVYQPWNGTYNQFYTAPQQSDSLLPGDTSATLKYSFSPFMASSLDYQVNMRVMHNDSVQEFCLQNNTDTVRYAITDYDYIRYKPTYSPEYFSNHIHGFNNELEIGNLYASPQFQFMTCLHIAVGPNTKPWTQVVAKIYEVDSAGNFTFLQSGGWNISPGEISFPGNLKIVHIPIWIYLNAGKNYFASVTNYLNPNDSLEIMALEPSQDSSSFILDSTGQWKVLDIVPYIGMNWFPHHSLEEHNPLAQVTCYPNPTNDRISITSKYSILEKIVITDITGKQVMTIPCQHTHQDLFINQLAPGVYIIHCYTNLGLDAIKFVKND